MAMLRVHLMQNWFGYSDPVMEEALYETTILRQFAELSLERIPEGLSVISCLGHMTPRSVCASQTKNPAGMLPAIPSELLESFGNGPMTAETINAASQAFKKALIERALAGEMNRPGIPGGSNF